MWSSWVKTKDTTQVMYIAKLKDGPKRVMKLSQMILKRVFENGMMEGEKMDSRKKILKLKYFSPLKILTSPFFQRLLELFFFPSSFFNTSLSLSLSFNALSLCGLGDFDDKRGEKHSSKFSFQMKWNGYAMIMEMRELWIYRRWTHISE
jgi:hypothetical protein